MVVGHVVLVAIVVELNVRLAVVAGVDVDAVVEDVGRGVGRVGAGDERRHDGEGSRRCWGLCLKKKKKNEEERSKG